LISSKKREEERKENREVTANKGDETGQKVKEAEE